MFFVAKEKTNVAYLLIVIVLAIIVGTVVVILPRYLGREVADQTHRPVVEQEISSKTQEENTAEQDPADSQEEYIRFKKINDGRLEHLVPDGWNIILEAEGDLNDDDLSDLAAVIQKDDGSGEKAVPRSLMIAFQNKEGKYILSVTSDKAISPFEGDWMKDDFDGLSVDDDGSLFVYFAQSRWGNFYKFHYQDGGWYLIRAQLASCNFVTGEMRTDTYDLSANKMERYYGPLGDNFISTFADMGFVEEEKTFDLKKVPLLSLDDFDESAYDPSDLLASKE